MPGEKQLRRRQEARGPFPHQLQGLGTSWPPGPGAAAPLDLGTTSSSLAAAAGNIGRKTQPQRFGSVSVW